jgi:hypothetical protein
MAELIRKVDYYYTTVSDKPGEGARVLGAIRDAGVNLLAFHAFPRAKKSQVDFVPENGAALKAAAQQTKIKLSGPKTVFLVEGDDRIGAIFDLLRKLGAANVNVTAIDAVRAGAGRYGALIWVKPAGVAKAAGALGAS